VVFDVVFDVVVVVVVVVEEEEEEMEVSSATSCFV
jgi:hypothetical protein